jgi:uncharacterized beta-barrel protein YwiB (DUF1934 family)
VYRVVRQNQLKTMKISKLIKQLQEQQEREGDLEVIMQGTFLQDGHKSHIHGAEEVFKSTVETLQTAEMNGEKCLQLYWQC